MAWHRPFSVFVLMISVLLFFSALGLSNGILENTGPKRHPHNYSDLSIVRELHQDLLELQILELTLKNRKSPQIEGKIAVALNEIHAQGRFLETEFSTLRKRQIETLEPLLKVARRASPLLGISAEAFDSSWNSLLRNPPFSGPLKITSGKREFTLFQVESLRVGTQPVWRISLPANGNTSFWTYLRSLRNIQGLPLAGFSSSELNERIISAQKPYEWAMQEIHRFEQESRQRLFEAFNDQRFDLFQRMASARRNLVILSKSSIASGVPEESATLYNQVLEHLFSFGLDISLNSEQRDLTIQGILFSPRSEDSQRLFDKMKFTFSTL